MNKQAIYFEGMTAPDFWAQLTHVVRNTVEEITTKPVDPTERMTPKEVRIYHTISGQTLRNWDKCGKLKPASNPDEKPYYLRGDVMAVPKKGKRLTTSKEAA